jgi:hypothetical protein
MNVLNTPLNIEFSVDRKAITYSLYNWIEMEELDLKQIFKGLWENKLTRGLKGMLCTLNPCALALITYLYIDKPNERYTLLV